jgi:hypothetical protein
MDLEEILCDHRAHATGATDVRGRDGQYSRASRRSVMSETA